MSKKYLCFFCGLTVTDEQLVKGVSDAKQGKDDNTANAVPSEVHAEFNPQEYKCPRCGEKKWSEIKSDPPRKGTIAGQLLNIWDKFTDVASDLIAPILIFLKNTEIQRYYILSRITAFTGLVLGVLVLNYLFNCGFDKAAIFMLLFYGLLRWK